MAMAAAAAAACLPEVHELLLPSGIVDFASPGMQTKLTLELSKPN